jgi:hypothetical protein
VAASTVARVERRECTPSPALAAKLERLFGEPLPALLRDAEEPADPRVRAFLDALAAMVADRVRAELRR